MDNISAYCQVLDDTRLKVRLKDTVKGDFIHGQNAAVPDTAFLN